MVRIRHRKVFYSRCLRLHALLHRRIFTHEPLYPLKDVKNRPVVQAEGSAKFGLPLQKIVCPLAVKRLDLFNSSMEIASGGFGYGDNCSYSVITTKRTYSYVFLKNTARFKKMYFLTCNICTIYAAVGTGSDRPTYTCRLCCSWCRLLLMNTTNT